MMIYLTNLPTRCIAEHPEAYTTFVRSTDSIFATKRTLRNAMTARWDLEWMTAVTQAIRYHRLNAILIHWDAQNLISPLAPSIRVWLLKSIAEIRTFTPLAVNRQRLMSAELRRQNDALEVLARGETISFLQKNFCV